MREERGLGRRDHALEREAVIGHEVNDSLGNGSGENVLCAVVADFV